MTVLIIGREIDGRIAPRSGLAAKNFIDTGAGVIDADYRGEVKVLLFNHSETDFEGERQRSYGWTLVLICLAVKEGDRVAQLVLERVSASSSAGVGGQQKED